MDRYRTRSKEKDRLERKNGINEAGSSFDKRKSLEKIIEGSLRHAGKAKHHFHIFGSAPGGYYGRGRE
jgi:hypothetical protein